MQRWQGGLDNRDEYAIRKRRVAESTGGGGSVTVIDFGKANGFYGKPDDEFELRLEQACAYFDFAERELNERASSLMTREDWDGF